MSFLVLCVNVIRKSQDNVCRRIQCARSSEQFPIKLTDPPIASRSGRFLCLPQVFRAQPRSIRNLIERNFLLHVARAAIIIAWVCDPYRVTSHHQKYSPYACWRYPRLRQASCHIRVPRSDVWIYSISDYILTQKPHQIPQNTRNYRIFRGISGAAGGGIRLGVSTPLTKHNWLAFDAAPQRPARWRGMRRDYRLLNLRCPRN